MPDTVSVAQLIEQFLNPVLNLLAALLRPLGILGVGVVAGSVVRQAVANFVQRRFTVPILFLGVAALFWAIADGRWSSPATLAALGFGLMIGYAGRPLRSPNRRRGPEAAAPAAQPPAEEMEPQEPEQA